MGEFSARRQPPPCCRLTLCNVSEFYYKLVCNGVGLCRVVQWRVDEVASSQAGLAKRRRAGYYRRGV